MDEDGRDGFTASGDTMNVAAGSSSPRPPVRSSSVRRPALLGGDAIVVEDVEPFEVKGKSERVPAFRLLGVREGVAPYARRQDAPFVGRELELERLRAAFDRAVRDRRCVLETLVGSAGVGKSRLTHEFTQAVEGTATSARRPLRGVRGGNYVPPACRRARAGSRGRPASCGARAARHCRPRGDGRRARRGGARCDGRGGVRRRACLGVSSPARGDRRRASARARARRHPLGRADVARSRRVSGRVFQWLADPRALSLATGAPGRSTDVGGSSRKRGRDRAGAVVARASLSSSSRDWTRTGTSRLDEARRILQAADGNPLFLEQLLALNVGRDAGSALVVPPTIQALLVARLDQLDAGGAAPARVRRRRG